MPQPLSRFPSNGSFVLANYVEELDPVLKRPKAAAMAMAVVSRFSLVELFLTQQYVKHVGKPTDVAYKMFLAMETNAEKKRALRIISGSFEKPKREAFDRIQKDMAAIQKSRNKLCHWVWGYLPDRTDCIVMADPRTMVERSGKMDLSKIFVFTEQDFTQMLRDIDALVGKTLEFSLNYR